jgi:predicted porin
MQKKLLALAVAGVLAAPAVAMAQSAVTISGIFKVGIDNFKIDSVASPANRIFTPRSNATGGFNTSETRITDNSSRIIFGITEDIGGGMAGIAQIDMRFQPDTGQLTAAGNTWVGLRGNSWGTVTLGRHDLHYGKQPDDIASKAGALMASSVSLMDTTYYGGAIAGTTRTNNVLRYDSPNWSGFAFTAAYSANPTAIESDLASPVRKGNAYNFNPSYTASNFGVGWSYWKQKADAGGVVPAGAASATGVSAANVSSINILSSDQTSNVFYGYYTMAGFKVGLAINKSKTETVLGAKTADRTNWTVPVSWTAGPHNVYAHYTKARKDKAADSLGISDTDAKMWAVAYVYDLSKRTSVGLTYAKIDNNTNAAYNYFTNSGSNGSTGSTLNPGEDATLIALTVRHAF